MSNSLRSLFLLCALGWAGLIFYLSHIPGVDVPHLFFAKDKLLHAVVFGILGFFALGAMKDTADRHPVFQPSLAVVLVIIYGVLDEYHQYFVPGRSPDIYDVMADAVGGILGVWLCYRFLESRFRKPVQAQR
jgi:VanZ family protein